MNLNKKILYFWFISLIFGFCVFQNFAKKEKRERRKQRKDSKIQKTWPKECNQKHYKKLTITGPVNLERATVSESANITGPAKIINSTINNLTMTGPLDADNTTFFIAAITGPVTLEKCKTKDRFSVTGSLKITNSTSERLKVTGPVSCKSSTIANTLEVTGTLEAYNSTMHDVEITTHNMIIFENSSAHKLIVHKNQSDSFWSNGAQSIEVCLKGKSNITIIEFEPNVKGIVTLEDGDASVGNVKNGIIRSR